MSIARIFVGIALASAMVFAQAPELHDSFRTPEFRLPYDQRLRIEAAAPLIVLGQVREVASIGKSRNSPGDSRVRTQLNRLKINVEEVVKGRIGSNTLEFYYFTYSSDNTVELGVPWYIPHVGQRRVFFLKPSNGSYRSVGDVTDYTLQVWSGVHAPGFCRKKEPGCCIAEMLLVPGRDVDVENFVQGLYKAGYAAAVLCSHTVASDLVTRLTTSSDERISDGARQVLPALHNIPK